ncbi:hypothetical protein [Paenibacillus gansuensis]|uniref:DUF5668 domain-containing protein n=1 Tax=Paenibacillus gansuensis TaxID=306542 RepID=A0ABW5PHU0_9BACL
MRQWRVGTFSMAACLIMAGLLLLSSQVSGKSAEDALSLWWPVIFILLGAEVLVYLAVHRRENPVLKWDMLSIVFVGFLGMVCLGVLGLSSTGVLQEVRYTMASVESTEDIPAWQQAVAPGVERIVVLGSVYTRWPIRLEASDAREVNVFGTYRKVSSVESAAAGSGGISADVEVTKEDFIAWNQVGKTLYITIKNPPQHRGFDENREPLQQLVLSLPKSVKLEYNAVGLGKPVQSGGANPLWVVKS